MLLEIPCAIIAAQILNRLCIKVHQPGMLGEIIAGIILGPCCFGSLSYLSSDMSRGAFISFSLDLNEPAFKTIAFIGAIFLMFIVGLETDIRELHKTRTSGFLAGLFSVIIPFCMGCAIGVVFHLTYIQSIIIGAILLTTSAVIAIRIFTDLRILSTPLGHTMKTAVIVNEILAMILFFIIFGNESPPSYLLQMVILFMITFGMGLLVISFLSHKKSFKQKVYDNIVPCGLVSCLVVAASTNNMSITSIIGAFVIGLMLRKSFRVDRLLRYVKQIGYSFFIPLFFVSVGASFDFSFLLSAHQMAPLMLFIGFFLLAGLCGNFFGGYIGSRFSGLNGIESRSIGLGMMPICGTALVLVTATIDKGYFGDPNGILVGQIKIATIMLIIVSSLITPILLKRSMRTTVVDSKEYKVGWSLFTYMYDNETKKRSIDWRAPLNLNIR
ncbi:MAG: cation:proton antiporter [Thermoplasmatota archaeon]